jgi:hypothetical protein
MFDTVLQDACQNKEKMPGKSREARREEKDTHGTVNFPSKKKSKS